MKAQSIFYAVLLLSTFSLIPFNYHPVVKSGIREKTVTYKIDTNIFKGFVAYPDEPMVKHPAIIIVHEWWGLNNYAKSRAQQLAKMGYVAFAADLFGNGMIAADPKEAQAYTAPFYKDPHLALTYINAAIKEVKKIEGTDPKNIAAIGYCFGGYIVLNAAKLGADLKAVVSFHGGLGGVAPQKDLLKAKILVCHGGNDKFVTPQSVDVFKQQMDSTGADYTFKVYDGATHAFTNPEATNIGKKFNMPIEYNGKADTSSWKDMEAFFNAVFGKK
jgi:dienelactone hydrolase